MSPLTTPRRLKFGSAFTGIAGFEKGFSDHGIEHTLFIEKDRTRHPCLRQQFPTTPLMEDIHDVTAASLGRIDGLVGGFPCKGISRADGNRGGIHDPRTKPLWEFLRLCDEYARLVDATNPRWLVMENAADLTSINKGEDLDVLVRLMVELGYGWAYRILDARNFRTAGRRTPQRRRRIVLVGHRGGDPRPAGEVLALGYAAGATPPSRPRRRQGPRPNARALLIGGEDTFVWRKGVNSQTKLDHVFDSGPLRYRCPPGCTQIHGYEGGYRETWLDDGEAQTLAASDVGNTRQKHMIFQHGRIRVPTPVEWERMQGFPDHWTAAMNEPDRYDGLGNSMHVGMASWLGGRLTAVHQSLPLLEVAA